MDRSQAFWCTINHATFSQLNTTEKKRGAGKAGDGSKLRQKHNSKFWSAKGNLVISVFSFLGFSKIWIFLFFFSIIGNESVPNPPPTVTAIFPVPKCPSIAGRTQNKPQPKLLSAVTAVLPVSILVVLQQTQFSELRFGHFRICYRRSQAYIRSQSAPKGARFRSLQSTASKSVIGGHSRPSEPKTSSQKRMTRVTTWQYIVF